MNRDLEALEGFFLDAMAHGYAASTEKSTIHELPGSKTITFERDIYKLVDLYYTTPHSAKSVGQTVIWCRNVPVWTMHYGGWYATAAIPFLKECLRRMYAVEQRFHGGRGPTFVRGERFTYFNFVQPNCSFADFEGKEHVYDLSEQCFGHHWYRGMSLLKD